MWRGTGDRGGGGGGTEIPGKGRGEGVLLLFTIIIRQIILSLCVEGVRVGGGGLFFCLP